MEILTGSASAIYGSDAISGVINFILKKKADGTTFDYRVGGDAARRPAVAAPADQQRLLERQLRLGIRRGTRQHTNPLWDFQRSYTDSRLDSPADPSDIVASQVFLRTDEDGNYLDPGKATCDALSYLDQGTVFYASRDPVTRHDGGPGYYCGSYYDVGYGTLENGRKMANFYGSATYHLNDYTDLFLDVLAGTSHQDSYNTPLQWQNSNQLNGDCTPIPFYNTATGQVEQWQRRYFTHRGKRRLQGRARSATSTTPCR